jgi:hypothetical protein
MTSPADVNHVWPGVREALDLLAALEEALEVVAQSDYLG